MIALLLFTLSAGAFDYGQAWRTGLTVNEATRTGARVGSAGGKDRAADFNAMSGLKASLASGGKLGEVDRVVIFRADSDSGTMPASCKTTTGNSSCLVMTGNQFRTNWESQTVVGATNADGCLNVISGTRSWCPGNRNITQSTAQYYGVWIRLDHKFLFPVVGSKITIERTAVMRLEPEAE